MTDNRVTQIKPKNSVNFKRGSKIGSYTINAFYAESSQSTIFTLDEKGDKIARVYFQGCEPDKELSELMKNTTNPSVCKILENGTYDNHYYEIVKRYDMIPPLNRLSKNNQTEVLRRELKAIQAFHNLGYCHLDIKSEHFMFDAECNVVLIDIGSAAKIGTAYTKEVSQFASPELYSGKFSKESDYFSFGVSIIEQYFPDLFADKNREEIIEYIQSSKIMNDCNKLPAEYREFVKSLLSDNPKARTDNEWFGKRVRRNYTQAVSVATVESNQNNTVQTDINALQEDIIFELLELAHKGKPILFEKQIKNAARSLNIDDASSATAFLNYLKTLPRSGTECNYTNVTKKNILNCLDKKVVTAINKINSRNPVTYMKMRCFCKKLYVLDKNQVANNDRTGSEISKISEERAWAVLKGIGITLGVIAAIAAAIGIIIVIFYIIAAIAIGALIIAIIAGLCSGL